MSKKLRKVALRIAKKSDLEIANEFKLFVNGLGFSEKLKLCFRILKGKL